MSRPYNSIRLLIAGLLLAIAGFAAIKSCSTGPKPPFELAVWYWHSPYTVSSDESKLLSDVGIQKVFVRAGTFTSDGENVVLKIPQSYKTKAKQDLHLVFNFDSGVIRHFEHYNLEKMSSQVAVRIDKQVDEAVKAGERVQGIQLDFDVPTRLLTRYGQLVHKIRSKLTASKLKFSSTGLMSWLGTSGIRDLSAELDFIVPQAYEGETGRTIETMRPVSDPDYFRRTIGKAGSLRCPFYIGIPAYGHGFLFDEQGKLASIYQNLGPAEALRHPSFKFISASPVDRLGKPAKSATDSVGEEIIKFRAVRPAPDGRGMGYYLAYTIPAADLLTRWIAAAREAQTSNCLGAVIYRCPEPESTLTLPYQLFASAIRGVKEKPELKVSLDTVRDNFDLIESSAPNRQAPKDIFLKVQNIGKAPTFISPDAVEIEIQLDTPGVESVRLRDFESVRYVSQDKQVPNRQASGLILSKGYLAPGESAYVGPIRLLTGQANITAVKWTARDGDGFQFSKGEQNSISNDAPTTPR